MLHCKLREHPRAPPLAVPMSMNYSVYMSTQDRLCGSAGCRRRPVSLSDYCADHLPDPAHYAETIREHLISERNHQDLFLRGAELSGLDLEGHRFVDCTFDEVSFLNCSFEKSLARACFFEDALFRECRFSGCDVKYSVFGGARFFSCDFSGSDILHTNFNGIEGSELNFSDSDLYYSSFVMAVLKDVRFIDCNLKKVNYIGSNRENVNFKYSNYEEAVFTARET